MNHPLFQHVDFEFLIDELAKHFFNHWGGINGFAEWVLYAFCLWIGAQLAILYMQENEQLIEKLTKEIQDQGRNIKRCLGNGISMDFILLRSYFAKMIETIQGMWKSACCHYQWTILQLGQALMQMPGCMKRWNHAHPHHVNVWQRRCFPMLFFGGGTDGSGHKWMNERVIQRLSISISFKNLWYSRLVCRIWCRMVIELNDAVLVPWGHVGMV